jgi:hypothetical protein
MKLGTESGNRVVQSISCQSQRDNSMTATRGSLVNSCASRVFLRGGNSLWLPGTGTSVTTLVTITCVHMSPFVTKRSKTPKQQWHIACHCYLHHSLIPPTNTFFKMAGIPDALRRHNKRFSIFTAHLRLPNPVLPHVQAALIL